MITPHLPSQLSPTIPVEASQLALTLLVAIRAWKLHPGYPRHLTRDTGLLRLTGLEVMTDKELDPEEFFDLLAARHVEIGSFRSLPGTLQRSLLVLRRELGLSHFEAEILGILSLIGACEELSRLLEALFPSLSHFQAEHLLASLLQARRSDVQVALSPQGLLQRSGLLRVQPQQTKGLANKFDLLSGLEQELHGDADQVDALLQRYFKFVSPGNCDLSDFANEHRRLRLLCRHIRHAVKQRKPGSNILFSGPPGKYKVDLCKALSRHLGLDLFQIPSQHPKGSPMSGRERLRSLHLAQHVLARRNKALLLFDEAEDLVASLMFEKEWEEGILRQMQENQVPTLWVVDEIDDVDPAYIRRFDWVIRLLPPGAEVVSDLLSFSEVSAISA